MSAFRLGDSAKNTDITHDVLEKLPEGLHLIMPSWWRLESRARIKDDFDEGLQARTADPLWYITRQWQLGEIQAEDAATICNVKLEYETEQVTHFALGKTGSYNKIPQQLPLEVLVEQEPVDWTWRMRIRAGQQFERYIRETLDPSEHDIENIIHGLYLQYPIAINDLEKNIDQASKRLVTMLANKAIHGQKLWQNRYTLPAELSEARGKLEKWYNTLYSRPSNNGNQAWQPKTLDYHFKVKTNQLTELASEHYRNGDLEWYTSNHITQSDPSLEEDRTQVLDNLMPNRVTFGGGPDPRWWNMEDSKVNLADLDTAKSDLIKTMFINFALIHGDDWFVVPLNLPIGSLTEVKTVTTTDVFGLEMEILNARFNDEDPLKRWDVFSLAQNDNLQLNADKDYLYIPYSSGFREESEALEEINFLRDEQANFVFGIEKTMLNAWGKPVSVFEYYVEQSRLHELRQNAATELGNGTNGTETAETENPQLYYKLATKVPKNWIPYIAEKIDMHGNLSQIFLKQARLPDVTESFTDSPFPIPKPLSKILKESMELNEEAVPRAGLKVKINAQRLRWIDGKTYVWIGRKVIHANRERASGLEFDVIPFKNGVANVS